MHFGAELSESTRRTLTLGNRIQTFFDQDVLEILPVNICVVILTYLWAGYWKNASLNNVAYSYNQIHTARRLEQGLGGGGVTVSIEVVYQDAEAEAKALRKKHGKVQVSINLNPDDGD